MQFEYFSDWLGGRIYSAGTDESNVQRIIHDRTATLALDRSGGKIYLTSWIDSVDDIRRANLDGTQDEAVFSINAGNALTLCDETVAPEISTLVAMGRLPAMGLIGYARRRARRAH